MFVCRSLKTVVVTGNNFSPFLSSKGLAQFLHLWLQSVQKAKVLLTVVHVEELRLFFPGQWRYFYHTLLSVGVEIHCPDISRLWKEGKFNLRGLKLPFLYRSVLRENSEWCPLKSTDKNYFVIIAILWFSECTLIDYLHNVVYYIMIFSQHVMSLSFN